ncbi:prolyl oligopeptidase family serine peptidase [Chryseobacterium sp.]|uniref:alpha/beta hydrolase family protein n=1 Tax=Chryseobacterium sp. TaxID=1871047 RepID=UPI0028A1D335|nr:prolyl oligopeptidase family serine peptidase [Chryseobacterium sp.]
MKAINPKIIFLILSFSIGLIDCVKANIRIDSTDNIKYYTFNKLTVSHDGRWSSVTRDYDSPLKDTLLIFDSHGINNPVFKIAELNGFRTFLDDNTFFITGSGKAKLIDLTSQMIKEFDKVKEAGVLNEKKEFFILGSDRKLSVYDYKGILQQEFFGINRIITDKVNLLFGVSEELKDNDRKMISDKAKINTIIYRLSSKKAKELFRTVNKIRNVRLTEYGSYLTVLEEETNESKIILSIFNHKIGETKSFTIGHINTFLKCDLSEFDKGEALWIDVYEKKSEENTLPEIWYGNDGDLKAKRYGYRTERKFFILSKNNENLTAIKDSKYPMFAPINNMDWVLAFNPRVNFKYSTRVPLPNLYLYNVKAKTSELIFENALETVVSPDGKHIVSYNGKDKKWYLWDVFLRKTIQIEYSKLRKPVFNSLGNVIYFESNDGFWKYNLKNNKLNVIKGSENQITSLITDNRQQTFNSEYHIYSKRLGDDNYIIEMKDDNNRTSFLVGSDSKSNIPVYGISNKVDEIQTSQDQKVLYSVEENFNLVPHVNKYIKSKNTKEIIDSGNVADKEVKRIRQDIVKFKNREGVQLKGVLYYPLDFNERLKYPMVVQIYQTKSSDANKYFYKVDHVGFDLRSLLKKGYFVYMPDIIYSNTGAGQSALHCVNAALDAILDNRNIDKTKIGLTGHSMGGYETNFIATHSNRFATYISGSAHSDLIRNYFSYNYSTDIPQIWRIETGQYEMGVTFAEDKERYFKNSPIHYVDQVNAPILLWAGKKDENVPWDQTMEFFMGLKRFDKDVIALFYKDGDHSFYETPKNNDDITKRSLEWWDYFLKDKRDIEWINVQIKKDAW